VRNFHYLNANVYLTNNLAPTQYLKGILSLDGHSGIAVDQAMLMKKSSCGLEGKPQ
jgi:hypothetical protein